MEERKGLSSLVVGRCVPWKRMNSLHGECFMCEVQVTRFWHLTIAPCDEFTGFHKYDVISCSDLNCRQCMNEWRNTHNLIELFQILRNYFVSSFRKCLCMSWTGEALGATIWILVKLSALGTSRGIFSRIGNKYMEIVGSADGWHT